MFRYTAEILPYHDYPLEDSIRELAEIGFTEVNLWSSASPLASHVNPGDDPGKILSILDALQHETVRTDDVRQGPAADAGAHRIRARARDRHRDLRL